MNLTIESLKQTIADLAVNAPPKKTVIVHGNTAYLFDDVPNPYFEPPKLSLEYPDLRISALAGWQIMLPEKFACVVHAGMAIPDALPPPRPSIRELHRHWKYSDYALTRRRWREQRHQR